jgi:hypothetical protein
VVSARLGDQESSGGVGGAVWGSRCMTWGRRVENFTNAKKKTMQSDQLENEIFESDEMFEWEDAKVGR